MKNQLSIYIPTYNRSEYLKKTLLLINDYNKFDISVFVLDNDSKDDTYAMINEIKLDLKYELYYTKNIVNIGGNANVIRCIEQCKTEWVWVLGDDDTILENCFDLIKNEIGNGNDICYINFKTDFLQHRFKNFTTEGLSDFINQMDDFGNSLFISTCIFNAKLIKPFLSYAYTYSYSLAPQLVLVFATLHGNNYKSVFSKEKIVGFQEVMDKDQKWSWFNMFLGVSTIFELLQDIDPKIMSKFAKKVTMLVRFNNVLFLYVLKYYQKNSFFRKYIFNQI